MSVVELKDPSRRGESRAAGRAFYGVVRLASRITFHLWNRMGVSFAAPLRSDGPVVIVANHDSMLDGFVLVAAFPERDLTFLSAAHLFERPLVGRFLRAGGALPVQSPSGDFGSLKRAISTLQNGGAIAVFPEGGIARTEILGGAAYLALKANALVVPVKIKGAREALPLGRALPRRTPIEVVVGKPFGVSTSVPSARTSKLEVSHATADLERRLTGFWSDSEPALPLHAVESRGRHHR